MISPRRLVISSIYHVKTVISLSLASDKFNFALSFSVGVSSQILDCEGVRVKIAYLSGRGGHYIFSNSLIVHQVKTKEIMTGLT